jgi:hypothetical protein
LIAAGIKPSKHWIFSKNCTGQFKEARAMHFVALYPGLMGGCSMKWNYFGSGHSKGIHYPLEAFLFYYNAIYFLV